MSVIEPWNHHLVVVTFYFTPTPFPERLSSTWNCSWEFDSGCFAELDTATVLPACWGWAWTCSWPCCCPGCSCVRTAPWGTPPVPYITTQEALHIQTHKKITKKKHTSNFWSTWIDNKHAGCVLNINLEVSGSKNLHDKYEKVTN